MLLVHAVNGFSQNKTWTGAIDSDWHKAGNWNPQGVPGTGATIQIRPQGGNPYPIISEDVTISKLILSEWYSGGDLTVSGEAVLTITNGFDMFSNANLYILDDSSVEITGGSVNMGGDRSQVIDIDSGGNLNILPGFTLQGTINAGAGDIMLAGNLTVSTGSAFNVENANITVDGSAGINGIYNGDEGVTDFNGTSNVNSGGITNLNTGIINFNSGATISNNGTLNMGSGTVNLLGTVNVSSGGYLNVQDGELNITGNAEFASNGNLSVDNGTVNVGGDASLSNGGSFDLTGGSLNVSGDASFTNGGTVNAGSSEMDFAGDFSLTDGGNFNSGTSTVSFSGTETQTINTDGQDLTFYNVKVKSGSSIQTDGSTANTIIIENNLTVEEGGQVGVQDDDTIDIQGNLDNQGEVQSEKPFIYAISTPSLTSVLITFDKAMDQTTVENTSNYSINNNITVSGATLNPSDDTQVTLNISTLSEGIEYELTVNNVQATDGGQISSNHKKRFTPLVDITYYSRTSGSWDNASSWSTESHTGTAASEVPNAEDEEKAIIGNGHTITLSSRQDVSNMEELSVIGTGTFAVSSGDTLILNNFVINGTGTFDLQPGGTIQIGSAQGITSAGTAGGNIRTSNRNYSSAANYIYTGSSSQSAGDGLPQDVNDFRINTSSDVTVPDNLRVNGTLYLEEGSLVITSENGLIANSKSIQNGNLIFRRILSGASGWRMISSPVDATYADFLDGIITQGYDGASYDASVSPYDTLQSNVLYYDETYEGTNNQRWRSPASGSSAVPAGTGINVYLFGDVESDSRYSDPLPDTLSAEGQEFPGTGSEFDFNVTYTAEADTGWNLLGNPYGATIDWDDAVNWTKTNMDNTIYVWDPDTESYLTWNGTTGSLGDGLLPPFQAFWVKADTTNPVLKVQQGAKTFGGSFVGKIAGDKPPEIEISIADGENTNSTYFTFSEGSKVGKDAFDAYLLQPPPGVKSYSELFSIDKRGNRFTINALPRKFGIPIEIPISARIFENNLQVAKDVTLSIEAISNIPAGWEVSLVDRISGKIITPNSGQTYRFKTQSGSQIQNDSTALQKNYKILADADPSKAQFLLKINPGADGSGLPKKIDLLQNYPNPFNSSTTIRFTLPEQNEVTVEVYDILGRKIITLIDNESFTAGLHTLTWEASNVSSSTYIYVMKTDAAVISRKMTVIK